MDDYRPEGTFLPQEGIFLQLVEDERVRSERYNHYFSVVLLRADRDMTLELFQKVKSNLRSSDVVTIVLSNGRYCRGRSRADDVALPMSGSDVPEAVGIALPETDREGAQVALGRLTDLISSWGEANVKVGYAVYPEDSTDATDLLSIACS